MVSIGMVAAARDGDGPVCAGLFTSLLAAVWAL